MWLPADPGKLKANFDEIEKLFGIDTALQEDQNEILLGILCEIRPEHYVGGRPPQQAYEVAILGKELFAFQWASSCCNGRQMYFKFCIKGTEEGRRIYVCSIHPSR
jgi:hypothetical protein